MANTIGQRFKGAWNAFLNDERDRRNYTDFDGSPSSGVRPDRLFRSIHGDGNLTASIFTQIAVDVSAIPIYHVNTDDQDRFISQRQSRLNSCLTLRANIDQSGRQFIQDCVMTLCEEGVIAIVPIDTTDNPDETGSYDILSMRVGRIVQWKPRKVLIRVYDDREREGGDFKEIWRSKDSVAIIENPLYSVMNEPNGTLQRLKHKLYLLDVVDDQSASGKIDVIIQLPYVTRSETVKQRARERTKELEMQLKGSKYGIAYADAQEKITQLNRPAENNLMERVNNLTQRLYGELGFSEELFNGTADEKMTLNYYNRTVEPILSAIVDGMKWAFLTQTARTQHQDIVAVRDPFRLVPVEQLAEIADKFTRNEILSSNEMRQVIGFAPVKDPKADELRNSNLNQSSDEEQQQKPIPEVKSKEEESE